MDLTRSRRLEISALGAAESSACQCAAAWGQLVASLRSLDVRAALVSEIDCGIFSNRKSWGDCPQGRSDSDP